MRFFNFFKNNGETKKNITLPKALKPYQDIWVQGRLMKSGKRNCARRYKLIYDCLSERYRPGFTLLDIGASEGYFSIRLSEDLHALPTMLEKKRTLKLVKNLQNSSDLKLKSGVIDAEILRGLGSFDVVVALSIVHHFPDWGRMLKIIFSICDTVIIELPAENERKVRRSRAATGMLDILKWHNALLIGETSGYAEEFKRQIYVVDFPTCPQGAHIIKGVVRSGRSSSAKQKKYYLQAVERNLSMVLYPGTLNLSIQQKLYFKNSFKIDSEKGTYHLFPCKIEGIPSYIVKPPRAKNKANSLEIFSEYCLREVFALNDGNSIFIEISPEFLGMKKEIEYTIKHHSTIQEPQDLLVSQPSNDVSSDLALVIPYLSDRL